MVSSNTTSCSISHIPMNHIHAIFSLIGFILNVGILIVICVVLKRRTVSQKPAYYFLFNLAISDACWTLLVAYHSITHLAGSSIMLPLCFFKGLVSLFRVAPSYFLLMKTVECYLFIVHGLTYHLCISTWRAKLMCVLTWVFVICITVLPSIGLYVTSWRSYDPCSSFEMLLSRRWYTITSFLLTLLPLCIILGLYSVLFSHIVGLVGRQETMRLKSCQRRPSSGRANSVRCFTKLRRHWAVKVPPPVLRSFKATGAVCLTFCVTWFPQTVWNIIMIYVQTRNPTCTIRVLYVVSILLGLTNPILDPFLYIWGYNDLKRVITGMWANKKRRKSEINFETVKTSV